jgi:signal transduction histidine kinase
MLHAFISTHRDLIISRVRARAAPRRPLVSSLGLHRGLPLFLNHLEVQLRDMAHGADPAKGPMAGVFEEHGAHVLAERLGIADVVQDYGDVRVVVTELAEEQGVVITPPEFRSFHRCLEEATLGAVTAYARINERSIVDDGAERLGILSHELRNALSTATLSFEAIRRGAVGTGGSVSAMHARSLGRLHELVERAMAEVRLDANVIALEHLAVASLVEEAEADAVIQARARAIEVSVSPVDEHLVVNVDRALLLGAMTNLLHNALKFTRPRSLVSLITRATADRVRISVEDQCGGLPAGDADELFQRFKQRSANRSGVGLGLRIARSAVEANQGELRVTDLAPRGCRFTIDLPRVLPGAAGQSVPLDAR